MKPFASSCNRAAEKHTPLRHTKLDHPKRYSLQKSTETTHRCLRLNASRPKEPILRNEDLCSPRRLLTKTSPECFSRSNPNNAGILSGECIFIHSDHEPEDTDDDAKEEAKSKSGTSDAVRENDHHDGHELNHQLHLEDDVETVGFEPTDRGKVTDQDSTLETPVQMNSSSTWLQQLREKQMSKQATKQVKLFRVCKGKPSMYVKDAQKLCITKQRQRTRTSEKEKTSERSKRQRIELSQLTRSVKSNSGMNIPNDGRNLCFGAYLEREEGFRPQVGQQPKTVARSAVMWLHDAMKAPQVHVRTATSDLGGESSRKQRQVAQDISDEDDESSEDIEARAHQGRSSFKYLPPNNFDEDFDFSSELQHVHWLLPAAPQIDIDPQLREKLDASDRFKMHRCWYQYNIENINAASENVSARHIPQHFESSLMHIEILLQKIVQNGIKWDQIVLGGFGQGAALAAAVALRCRHALGGVILQNGWIPEWVLDSGVPQSFRPPFLVINGDFDPVVKPHVQESVLKWLRQHQFPTVHVKAWFLNHCDAVLMRRRVLQFLCEVIPPSGNSRIQTQEEAEKRSCVFPVPDELSTSIRNFDLEKFSQIRGLV